MSEVCTKCGEDREAAGYLCEKCAAIVAMKTPSVKFFLIVIGRVTRRGGFEELVKRVVSVPAETKKLDVYDYFKKKYSGLDVDAIEIFQIEDLSIEKKSSVSIPKPSVCSFNVPYTEQEKELHQQYENYSRKAEDFLSRLEQSIRQRYNKLFYVQTTLDDQIVLNTTYRGTVCERLPLRVKEFTEAARGCQDDL